MDRDRVPTGSLQQTTLNPELDKVELGAWVPPIECEGCGGRVDTFLRYNRNTKARCSGCGSEWEFVSDKSKGNDRADGTATDRGTTDE